MSKQCLLNSLNSIIGTIIIHPIAIIWWRGTWDLLDYYIYPKNIIISSQVALIIGIVFTIIGYLFHAQFNILKEQDNNSNKYSYAFLAMIFVYLISWVNLCYWRGFWNIVDLYLGNSWMNSLLLLIIATLIMCFTKTFRTAVGVPFSITIDNWEVFQDSTARRINYKERPYLYVLDAVFSQYVIISCNILIWRGFWNIYDDFFFPGQHFKSNFFSIFIGYGAMITLFMLSPLLTIIAQLFTNTISRHVYECFVYFIATGVTLMAWRGGWNICEYYIPYTLIGGWICHVWATFCLVLMKVFSNVALNGIEIDCENDASIPIFTNNYHDIFCNDQKDISFEKDIQILL